MSKKISLISLFSTIFFLIITVVLGLIIHYLGDPNEPIFALFGTLFIGMFLCLLTCLSNLNTLIKIYDDQQKTTKDIYISTCPDYWTKRHVFDQKTRKQATMCHNISPTNELVYGSLDGENFKFTTSNLTQMREKAEYPETQVSTTQAPVTETFITSEDSFRLKNRSINHGDPDFEKYHHYHDDVVVNVGDSSIIAQYDDSVYNETSLRHPHVYSGPSEYFSHSHRPGESDENLFGRNNQNFYSGSEDNFNNWINPYNANGLNTIELNLKQMNSAENTCDLTRHFAWSEAEAKCAKKKTN